MSISKLTPLLLLSFLFNCSDKQISPVKPEHIFVEAKEPYDDGNFEIAINRLGEFKARFPYSKFATESELLIADSHYQLSQYAESAAYYEQFIKLHPKHPKVPFAQFRIGESYWAEAPEESNREQDLTKKAIAEWERLLKNYPESTYSKKAQELIKKGLKRIAESDLFVAEFYCKQSIWHACAFRHLNLAEKIKSQFPALAKKSYKKASSAFEKMANNFETNEKDKNLYFKKMTKEDLKKKSQELIKESQHLPG